MDALRWFRLVHLVAAAVWLGGIVVLGPVVVAVRSAGAPPEAIRAGARAFARVTWTAMAVAVVTGLVQVQGIPLPWSYGRLHAKLGAVGAVIAVTLLHQTLAGRVGPRARGAMELLVLLTSLAVYACAVRLRG
jgi:putative copper export protein